MASHEATVRKVAAEYGASVTLGGNGHWKLEGKGWRVFVPSTPRHDWSEVRVRNHVRKRIHRCTVHKLDRGQAS